VIVSRRPEAVLHAAFFAEDGKVWFQQAFNDHWWNALLITDGGYFQTLSRIVAAFSLLVPLRQVPLLMNLTSIAIEILPVAILLSARLSSFAPLRARVMMAAAYLMLPNTQELNANLTTSQWHFALAVCLLILGDEPVTRTGKALYFAAALLCGLSGLFCLLLVPAVSIYWWRERDTFRARLILALTAPALLQAFTLFRIGSADRPQTALGAGVRTLLKLLGGQIYLGALIGPNSLATNLDETAILLAIVTALGTAVICYCAFSANLEWRVFLLFCGLVFAASLRSPMIAGDAPRWNLLAQVSGCRYWLFPTLAFVWSLIWCISVGRSRTLRHLALVSLGVMTIGVVRGWHYPPYRDFNFESHVKEFERAAPGTHVLIPVHPGGIWVMDLVKK
jgi:hypothetical protein